MNADQFAKFKKWHDYVATVPPGNLYMQSFVNKSGFADVATVTESLAEHRCGTAACAIGYLPIALPEDFTYGCAAWDCFTVVHRESGYDGFSAASEPFGTSLSDAIHIGQVGSYGQDNQEERAVWLGNGGDRITPAEVCAHMREVAAKYGYTIEPPLPRDGKGGGSNG